MSLWRHAPLWLRLVTGLLLLSALALAVSGFAGGRLLRGYLVDEIDRELLAVRVHVRRNPGGLSVEVGSALPNPFHYSVLDTSGVVQDAAPSLGHGDTAPDVAGLTTDEAAGREGRPFTVDSDAGDGRWRVVALTIEDDPRSFEEEPGGTIVVGQSLDDVDATVARLRAINMLVGLAVLGGLALAGYGIVRSALRPLAEIERTAGEIAAGDLTRRIPEPDPGTEVGRLGFALNTMLDHLETAFRDRERSEASARSSENRMRQFVADASHELRTPLTSIRGFSELYRQGALADPATLPDVFGRIEDEATRMGLLVDDLLVLARLDQERPLATEPVDLSTVVRDAVDAARALAPERPIELSVADEPVVVGDESRLRQVVSNLLDNARRHTPPDSAVELSLAAGSRDDRPMAVLEVRDHGPGLTTEQRQRVFERFYRTDAGRARAAGGTGLGLSIVAAIATAHGGTAEVDSTSGGGATFRVLLPLAEPAPTTD
ncbi:MAG: sensor histidine kinase [Acidimicrobiales bacterium]